MVVIKPFVARRARVELIPLIDTFFLLLSFFIFSVFSMSMQEGLQVDLPTAESAAPSKEDTLTISITAEGTLFLNQEPAVLDTLAQTLQQRRATFAQSPLVLINADRHVPHGTVMSVLDAVRQAQLTRVSFQAQPEAP
jgi:biopolymer transport protein ExbD